jgi:hypothetical protein
MNKPETEFEPHHDELEKSGLKRPDGEAKVSINERLARRGNFILGSMWTFYAFVTYGALGAILVAQQATLLDWSNWIQLWSMPLLMVGGLVIGKASEKRAQQTHENAFAVLNKVQ